MCAYLQGYRHLRSLSSVAIQRSTTYSKAGETQCLVWIVLFGLQVLWSPFLLAESLSGSEDKVLRRERTTCPRLSATTSSTGHQEGLDEILLWVFARDVLRVRLVVEGEVLAVFLFDALHFLVSVRLFFPVEESGAYRQDGHNDKDHHCNDACKAEDFIHRKG